MLDSEEWWNVRILKVEGLTKSVSNNPRAFGSKLRPLTKSNIQIKYHLQQQIDDR